METQRKFVSKEEAHRLIEDAPGNKVMLIQYNGILGISDCGKYIKKKKGKKFVDKSSVVVLIQNNPIMTLNLHQKFFSDFCNYDREDIVRKILLPKLE